MNSMSYENTSSLSLDGDSLTVEQLMGVTLKTKVVLSEEAWKRIRGSRVVINNILAEGNAAYGINTGFGNFSEVRIDPKNLSQLQVNLIRSHASGVGNFLTPERVKRLLILRINVLAKGYSGIGEVTLSRMISFCNAGCVSKVPEQGTLGASGDLAPLAHLALGMMGEGDMWDPDLGCWSPASEVARKYNLSTLDLLAKEGLALINGTQFISALGAEAIWRAENLIKCADSICAVSVEALQGTVKAYFPEVHKPRPHSGQRISAATMRSLLHSSIHPSEIAKSHKDCSKVQDAYSLRCAPQVHGVVYDTLEFVKKIIETEMNSATDNPMVFRDTGKVMSGGNFHGEYPAKVLDFLAISVHELGSISERRVERLVNSTLSGLPAFLVADGGLNSGFMIPHCTSAALVSENKTLAHPASVDSISTSAEKEDHVSMGGWAAVKCLRVVSNVENILAIELLSAVQGLQLRRPLTSTEPIEKIFSLVREAGIKPWDQDRYFHPDILKSAELIKGRKLINLLEPYWRYWKSLNPNNNYEYVC